jgi:hypothetical protein
VEVMTEREMIELIREMTGFLSREPLTVEDVIARVGPVTEDPGGSIPIRIRPDIAGIDLARLMRDPASGLPDALQFDFAPDARPKVKALREAFGDYERILTHRDRPSEIMFHPTATGTPRNVVVVARLSADDGTIDEASAASITFLRNPL